MNKLIGKTLGPYQIETKIAEGGMATIFKAYQPSLERHIALKVLSPSSASKNPVFAKRFRREAKSIARLHHPNILSVYDFGIDQDYNYIAMRYVEEARTFGELMRKSYDPEQLIDYLVQIAAALTYAHQQGVVHRDVKPSNVLIDQDGWALLSDFGLVKLTDAVSKLTEDGKGVGTAAYMSPEQAKGIAIDHRTDIYALGVIVYEIFTRTIPHQAATPLGILLKRTSQPPLPPSTINPAIDERVEQIILRALANKPADRYESATDFIETLQQALAGIFQPEPESETTTDESTPPPDISPDSEAGPTFKEKLLKGWLNRLGLTL